MNGDGRARIHVSLPSPAFASLGLLAGLLVTTGAAGAAKLTDVRPLDRDYLKVRFLEGEVKFQDDGGTPPPGTGLATEANWVEEYGSLDAAAAAAPESWRIVSEDDEAFAKPGRSPRKVFRKSKIAGMAQLAWDEEERDFRYEAPLDHVLYLLLPSSLKEGARYELAVGGRVAGRAETRAFVFDSFRSVSEALHVNLVGYPDDPYPKAADLYHWLGDGGARDYSAFEGAKVHLIDAVSGERREAGVVTFWMKRGRDLGGYDFTASDVRNADFVSAGARGRFRIAIEGVGCSPEFEVGTGIYEIPFKVSLKGFYFMRIGEPVREDLRPIPRQPRFIPGEDPPGTKILITTMHPYHPEWKTFAPGDKWDRTEEWKAYVKPGAPENAKAAGGHSDALDWDRHLGHVSIVYDMLLPYFLTGGALADDDAGIAESGNGIPDLLDEARNEVDFWLSLRDGEGYGHGLTNPNREHVFFQAGATAIAAWASAANAAMLSDAFRIADQKKLSRRYLRLAVDAYEHADGLDDPQLDEVQGLGGPGMRGADFKMTAAAHLFNLTGKRAYEDAVKALSHAGAGDADDVAPKDACQLWASAAYLLSPRKVRDRAFRERLREAVLRGAEEREAALAGRRPSRRASNQEEGYFHTAQNVQRLMLAHRIAGDPSRRARYLAALIREADWGLGRNPMNMIQMTTATTPLEDRRSVVNAYTSGRDDGVPGLHPGHTPYFNTDDWGRMIMARPRWMAAKSHPAFDDWPRGEACYNTRWVWAHTEFTPQQTMRGKTALYGYLYGLSKQRGQGSGARAPGG